MKLCLQSTGRCRQTSIPLPPFWLEFHNWTILLSLGFVNIYVYCTNANISWRDTGLSQGTKVQQTFLCVGGFLDGLDAKEPACNAGDPGSVPGWGRSPEEGDGSPL